MKEYRKKLVIESVVLGIISLVLIIVQVLAFNQVIQPVAAPADWIHWADFWNGMIAGMSMGVTILFISGIIVNIRAIRSEARLKKLYAKENDERTQQIVTKAQSMGMRISIILLLAAVIVLGYFDIKMSIVCLCCAFVQSVITLLCKLYWSHAL